jgi:hypothetical protein
LPSFTNRRGINNGATCLNIRISRQSVGVRCSGRSARASVCSRLPEFSNSPELHARPHLMDCFTRPCYRGGPAPSQFVARRPTSRSKMNWCGTLSWNFVPRSAARPRASRISTGSGGRRHSSDRRVGFRRALAVGFFPQRGNVDLPVARAGCVRIVRDQRRATLGEGWSQ